jgi:HPt (histidine-containing phosphotransfer) domain-containing protein
VLAKPLEIGKLRELLQQHGFHPDGAVEAASAPTAPSAKPLDLDQLRGVVGDDTEFMHELCDTFIASSTQIVSELAQALAAADRTALSSLAHKLKGGSSSVCAHELAKLAAALEKDSKEKSMPELEASVGAVQRAFAAVKSFVAVQSAT